MMPLTGLRALVVEDDADSRDVFALVLRHNGAEVVTAEDRDDALQSLASGKPNVVIADLLLSTTTAFELLPKLRSLGCTAPVIALTGLGDEATKRKLTEAGFDAYALKPIDPDELVRVVRKLVGRS